MLVEPEPLTQTSFDAVSLNGAPKSLLHHQPQTMLRQSIAGVIDGKMGGACTPPDFLHPMKLCGCLQSFMWSEAE